MCKNRKREMQQIYKESDWENKKATGEGLQEEVVRKQSSKIRNILVEGNSLVVNRKGKKAEGGVMEQ